MGKGLPRSLARANPQAQGVIKKRVLINDLPITSSGATGVGFSATVASDFPEGNLYILAAVAYLAFRKDTVLGAAGTLDTFDGDYSVGTTPTADATLSGTDANIIGSTSTGPAVAGVGPAARGTSSTAALLDNTDGSLEVNLNLILDDASVSADAQHLLADGYIDILYAMLGDD